MEIHITTRRTEAFTQTELFVVIGVVAVLGTMLLPVLSAAKKKTGRINCVKNLHEIGVAGRTREGDNRGKYPMQFYATNIFGIKLMNSGNAWYLWRMLSNELNTPKVLHCPDDTPKIAATNFTVGFSDANISYFLNLDALNETYPQMLLDGDDNLAVNGVRVKPGILNLPTTNSLAWTKERHRGSGNIGMADGSVMQVTSDTLNSLVIAATNGAPANMYRLVIP